VTIAGYGRLDLLQQSPEGDNIRLLQPGKYGMPIAGYGRLGAGQRAVHVLADFRMQSKVSVIAASATLSSAE
jgi:hypothetical protein